MLVTELAPWGYLDCESYRISAYNGKHKMECA